MPRMLKLSVKDQSIRDAVALLSLKDKSDNFGLPMTWSNDVHLVGDAGVAGSRKISVETGEVTFFEALDKLCAAAGMGNNPSEFRGEKNLPVETVSWGDCQEFIKKLREKNKKSFRLPTEAEWEYACRAGTTTPFHFGETISTDQANYDGNSTYGAEKKGVNREKTTPVGSFPANAWGLHDMHGNVLEWCQDWFGDYPQKEDVDPQGPEKGEVRVLRGGSWTNPPQCRRSARRFRLDPGIRFNCSGFRICFCLD